MSITANQLEVASYFLSTPNKHPFTKLEKMYNPDQGHTWAIRTAGGDVLSKKSLSFEHEPLPSSRDEQFYQEFRFATVDEALECWNGYQQKNKPKNKL